MNLSPFTKKLQDVSKSIFRFSREIMNFEPTKQQAQLLEKVQFETFAPLEQIKKGIFVASGQGPGKTSATAVCAAFRLIQVKDSLVVVTSPTAVQCQDIWIGEFRRRIGKSVPEFQRLFDISNRKVSYCGRDSWGIRTRTASREANAQGYHETNMTVIADEASGIPRSIWQVFKGTLTQPGNLLIGVGNPNDRDTEFFDAFNKDAHLYHTLVWSSEDSPNVDKSHIKKMEAEYGRESDAFRVRVLGQFPRESPNVVIRYEDVIHAFRKTSFLEFFMVRTMEERYDTRQFGIDLARFGSDESVICARINSATVGYRYFSKMEPADVLLNAMAWQKELGWPDAGTVYCVDAGGMGQGCMNELYRHRKRVFEFHSQGTPSNADMFHDAITEAYFQLKNLTRNKAIHMKEDNQLLAQLVNRQYKYDNDGKFRLESKDEYKDRKETEEYTSPDRADATALAFYPYAGGGVSVASLR